TLAEEEKRKLITEVLTPIGHNLMVTPKEVDGFMIDMANVIAKGINDALHENVDHTNLASYTRSCTLFCLYQFVTNTLCFIPHFRCVCCVKLLFYLFKDRHRILLENEMTHERVEQCFQNGWVTKA